MTVKPRVLEATYPNYGCSSAIPLQASATAAIPLALYTKMFKK